MTIPAIDLHGDVHVHSAFSDDATGTLAQNIEAAAARRLTVIRLVEHVRRSTAWLPGFVAAARRTPRPPGLTVLTGVEAKLLDARGRLDLPPGWREVDAVVIADHQFPGPDGPWTPAQTRARLADGLDPADAIELLLGAITGAMTATADASGSAQLAHCFSILPKIGLDEGMLSTEQLERWAGTAARTGTLIEVNEKWACPGPRAIAAATAAGALLAAASDSHEPSAVGRYRVVPVLIDEAAA
ncbi:MAG TPA: histidinol-phosphatase [Pseudolysinimonas sp.]|nr:histidinol-phosphatase [Pseudolysinimonas sp.]